MAKNTRGQKEFSKEQELKHEGRELRKEIRDLEGRIRELEKENARLRRQAAGSRKELAKMDLDRHAYVQEIVQEHLTDEQESIDSAKLLKKIKEKWRCHECHTGHLEIILYSKMGTPWYHRQCSDCKHRTKSQPHHPGVEGIRKEVPAEPAKVNGSKPSNSLKIRK